MAGRERITESAANRLRALPLECGNSTDPGVVASDDWRDWSGHATTADQERIEDYLDRFHLAGKRILHVGIGNSSLARRFGARAHEVVGISIDPPELALANSLGVTNYRVIERNKYAGLGADLDGPFDFVIDNNISSACCCLSHLIGLLEGYRDRLAPGGQILTDREGLGWMPDAPRLNPRWRFSLEDLACAAELAGLSTEPIGEHLAALSRGYRARPTVTSRTRRRLRLTSQRISRRLGRWRKRLGSG